MELLDSRRLTGPNVFGVGPGVVIDATVDDAEREPLLVAWREAIRRMLDALGWHGEQVAWRVHPGGLSVAHSAPIDALYAATEVNEWAWSAAVETVQGRPEPSFADAKVVLGQQIAEERNPPLLALARAAADRGVLFLSDDEVCSVGTGRGSQSWPVGELPAPGAVEWSSVHDVKLALVTGTNGKTTTVRMLAAIARAAGLVPGFTTTDGIVVGDEPIDAGDYSGPGGARQVLRDRRVEVAVLETARGGMLRRGLAVSRADVAVITNVAADHLGEFGVADVDGVAETKLLVARVAARLVANADDAHLVRRIHASRGDDGVGALSWFSLLGWGGIPAEDDACVLLEGALMIRRAGAVERVLAVVDIPATVAGAARHNIANAAAAVAAAVGLGLSLDAIRTGLRQFDNTTQANPGRANVFDFAGVRAVVDFAHNAHGLQAIVEMVRGMGAERVLVVLGQAGDRDDASIRELARVVWSGHPDRVVVKEMTQYLRGREAGEVPRLLVDELTAAGAPDDAIEVASSELDAMRRALAWSRPGDVLLLLTHAERGPLLELLQRTIATGWTPGDPLPE